MVLNRPYVIVSPPYAHHHGGIKVLHYLCELLNIRGERAYVLATDGSSATHPRFHNVRTITTQDLSYIGDYIGIYPEIFEGNPIKARTVVRWLLAAPGSLGGPASFPRDDIIVWYNRATGGQPHDAELYAFYVEPEFNDRNLPEKKYHCLWVGKGAPWVPRGFMFDGEIITRSWPARREELAELLRQSKLLVCFDYATGLFHESAMCGTPVLYIGPRDKFRSYWGTIGIAFDEHGIEFAKAQCPEIWKKQKTIDAITQEQLTSFIGLTQGA